MVRVHLKTHGEAGLKKQRELMGKLELKRNRIDWKWKKPAGLKETDEMWKEQPGITTPGRAAFITCDSPGAIKSTWM